MSILVFSLLSFAVSANRIRSPSELGQKRTCVCDLPWTNRSRNDCGLLLREQMSVVVHITTRQNRADVSLKSGLPKRPSKWIHFSIHSIFLETAKAGYLSSYKPNLLRSRQNIQYDNYEGCYNNLLVTFPRSLAQPVTLRHIAYIPIG